MANRRVFGQQVVNYQSVVRLIIFHRLTEASKVIGAGVEQQFLTGIGGEHTARDATLQFSLQVVGGGVEGEDGILAIADGIDGARFAGGRIGSNRYFGLQAVAQVNGRRLHGCCGACHSLVGLIGHFGKFEVAAVKRYLLVLAGCLFVACATGK